MVEIGFIDEGAEFVGRVGGRTAGESRGPHVKAKRMPVREGEDYEEEGVVVWREKTKRFG